MLPTRIIHSLSFNTAVLNCQLFCNYYFSPLLNQPSALRKSWPLTARWWEWVTMERTASWLACPWSTSLENASTTSLWSPQSAWQTTGRPSVEFGQRISKMVRQTKAAVISASLLHRWLTAFVKCAHFSSLLAWLQGRMCERCRRRLQTFWKAE